MGKVPAIIGKTERNSFIEAILWKWETLIVRDTFVGLINSANVDVGQLMTAKIYYGDEKWLELCDKLCMFYYHVNMA